LLARSLALIGVSDDEIATQLHVSHRKVGRLYKRELLEDAAEGNRQVLESLHAAAKSGANMAATALWVKARCGWRDTGPPPPPKIIYSKLIVRVKDK
jgi:orotate phosphoribosyltransferase-like protein